MFGLVFPLFLTVGGIGFFWFTAVPNRSFDPTVPKKNSGSIREVLLSIDRLVEWVSDGVSYGPLDR